MPSLEQIIGAELYKQLSEETKKQYDSKTDLKNVADGSYITKEKFDQLDKEAKDYKKQVKERDAQITKLKEDFKGTEGLAEKIADLEKENKVKDETYQKELNSVKLNNAIDGALKAARAKNPKAVKALLEMEKIKLDGEILLGFEDQLKSIQKDNEYMFEKEVKGTGSFGSGGVVGGTGGKDPDPTNFATQIGKKRAEQMKSAGLDKFIIK